MQGEDAERLKILCKQAAVELDHDELMRLVREITGMLDKKENESAKGAPDCQAACE